MPPDRIISFDLETAAPHDHIVEIGCIEIIGGCIGRSYHALVRPAVSTHWACYRTHGLSDARLSYEPCFAELVHDFADFVGDSPFLCHNASYERRVLRQEMDRLDMVGWQDEEFFCTWKMARKSGLSYRNGLRPVCEQFGISICERRPGYHDALNDALMCAEVYLRLCDLGYKL
ncbi:MAG: exonuclease domain-containing protein [Acetobacteraceae bacterium]